MAGTVEGLGLDAADAGDVDALFRSHHVTYGGADASEMSEGTGIAVESLPVPVCDALIARLRFRRVYLAALIALV